MFTRILLFRILRSKKFQRALVKSVCSTCRKNVNLPDLFLFLLWVFHQMLIRCNLLLVCVNTRFPALTLVLQFRGAWVLEKENSVNTLQVTFWVYWNKGKPWDTWISSTCCVALASLTNRASYDTLSMKSWKPLLSLPCIFTTEFLVPPWCGGY